MNTSTGKRVRTAIVTLTLAGAANGFLAACGTESEAEDQTVYCADEDGNIVDQDLCDDDDGGSGGGGGYFFFVGSFGGNSYGPGDRIPNRYLNQSSGTTRVNPSDSTARSNAGLPRSGPVASGSRVSGGIGSGSVGSGS